MSRNNLSQQIQAALSAGVDLAKVATGDCSEEEKKEKKKNEKEEAEEKKASLLNLADLNTKVASFLRSGGDGAAALPNSDISTVKGKFLGFFGHGKQQPKDIPSPPASGVMPTTEANQPQTTNSAKIAGIREMFRKVTGRGAADLPTQVAGQAPSGAGMNPTHAPPAVASNQAIINAPGNVGTQANQTELNKHFQEPAGSPSTDAALNAAFNHHPGSKLATAQELFVRLPQESSR